MGLWDVSKNHDRRAQPEPNQNDQVIQRMAHGTTQNHNAGEVAQADGLKFFERQILAKQDGNNKAVFGFLESTSRFGLKVAQAGVDVLTASDEQLVFNSEQNVFKIVQTGISSTAVVPVNTGGSFYKIFVGSTNIPHGLSYTPIVQGYLYDGSNYTQIPYTQPSVSSGAGTDFYILTHSISSDATNISIITQIMAYNENLTIGAQPVNYYVLQESAA